MTLEEAVKNAIAYETRIRDLYKEAAEKVSDPSGRRLFEMLRDDEQYHLDYLSQQLGHWQKTGTLSSEKLRTVVISKEKIDQEMKKLEIEMARDDRSDEKQMLSKALKVEVETSEFYRSMIDETTDIGRQMFAQFLRIEDTHIDMVQAQLDYLTKTGYWFDVKEFGMEAW